MAAGRLGGELDVPHEGGIKKEEILSELTATCPFIKPSTVAVSRSIAWRDSFTCVSSDTTLPSSRVHLAIRVCNLSLSEVEWIHMARWLTTKPSIAPSRSVNLV